MKMPEMVKKYFTLVRILWLPPLILLFAWLWPVNNGITRWLIVFGAIGTWGVLLCLVNRQKLRHWITATIICIPLLGATLIAFDNVLPLGRSLREPYLAALRNFSGTPYVWGGENAFGMDCSGLPRAALRRALFRRGIAGEPGLLRLMIKNWWVDASAKALMQGYRQNAIALHLAGTVASAPESLLIPGDLAITDDGVHVMIYLGPDEWISADPGQGKVVIEHPSKSQNPWFSRPVHFFRLYELANWIYV